jgi:hypothetical protein
MIRASQLAAMAIAHNTGAAVRSVLVDSHGTVWRFTQARGFEDISLDYTGPERRREQR